MSKSCVRTWRRRVSRVGNDLQVQGLSSFDRLQFCTDFGKAWTESHVTVIVITSMFRLPPRVSRHLEVVQYVHLFLTSKGSLEIVSREDVPCLTVCYCAETQMLNVDVSFTSPKRSHRLQVFSNVEVFQRMLADRIVVLHCVACYAFVNASGVLACYCCKKSPDSVYKDAISEWDYLRLRL